MSDNNYKNTKNKLVSRFERMSGEPNLSYFDISDIEEIVEFYIEDNNIEKAKRAIDYGFKLHGDNYSLIILEAKYQIAQINFAAAEKSLKKAEKDSPENGEVDLLRAMINIFMKNYAKADKFIKKGLRKSANSADYMLVPLGMAFLQQKKYTEAAVFLKKYYERYQDADEILTEIAFAYYQASKFRLSLKFYQKHIDVFPYDEQAWIQLARIYNELEMPIEAIEAYDFALSINPALNIVFIEKGSILLAKNEPNKALICFNKYLKTEKNGTILQKIGEAYSALNNISESQKNFKEALNFADARTDTLYFQMAKNYLELENYSKALNLIDKSILQNESNPNFLLIKGLVLTKLGKYKEAENIYKTGLKINDKHIDLWLNYSELYYYQDNTSIAIDILDAAIVRLDNQFELLYRLTAYCLVDKNYKMAKKYFELAINCNGAAIYELINFYPASLKVAFVKKTYNQIVKN
ncbi:MAG: tetratricopeptide repeat protein [Bacteroidales bacterium]|nr:tetratricopeptide repeat protein [Bacteroidales bacterium]